MPRKVRVERVTEAVVIRRARELFGTDVGVLIAVDDSRVVCHICDRAFKSVATHAVQAHGVTADEYRRRFGLSVNHGLVANDTKAKMAANAKKHNALAGFGRPSREAALRGAKSPKRAEYSVKLSLRSRGRPLTAEARRGISQARLAGAYSSEIARRHWASLDSGARLRRLTALRSRNHNREKTECKRGHPFSGKNLRVLPSGKRVCRACDRLRAAHYRAKT